MVGASSRGGRPSIHPHRGNRNCSRSARRAPGRITWSSMTARARSWVAATASRAP